MEKPQSFLGHQLYDQFRMEIRTGSTTVLTCKYSLTLNSVGSRTLSFVDRDIFMRFLGGGIGHKATWDMVENSDPTELETNATPTATCGDEELQLAGPMNSRDNQDEVQSDDDQEPDDEEGSVLDSDVGNSDTEANNFGDPKDGEGDSEDYIALEGYRVL